MLVLQADELGRAGAMIGQKQQIFSVHDGKNVFVFNYYLLISIVTE